MWGARLPEVARSSDRRAPPRRRLGDDAAERLRDEAAERVHDAAQRRRDEAARDQRLVGRALAGDLDAFNRLVELYQDYLFAMTVRDGARPGGRRGCGAGGLLQRLPQPDALPRGRPSAAG